MQQPIPTMIEAAALLFTLLNPFLLSIYLLELVQRLRIRDLAAVLARASAISGIVFFGFAWAGDAFFSVVLQARFEAFLLFGGILFLVIGIRFVLAGSEAVEALRGSPEQVAGAVAMPFMIGPGTVSASILAGSRLPVPLAFLSIFVALALTAVTILLLKSLHDYVREKNERIVQRYIDIVGRLSAFVIGTVAVEMILRGVDSWLRGR